MNTTVVGRRIHTYTYCDKHYAYMVDVKIPGTSETPKNTKICVINNTV